MSWDLARIGIKMADVAVTACEVIQSLTGLGGAPAAEVLQAIDGIVKSVAKGMTQEITPEQVLTEITSLHGRLAADRAATDKAIDDKFGGDPGGTPPPSSPGP